VWLIRGTAAIFWSTTGFNATAAEAQARKPQSHAHSGSRRWRASASARSPWRGCRGHPIALRTTPASRTCSPCAIHLQDQRITTRNRALHVPRRAASSFFGRPVTLMVRHVFHESGDLSSAVTARYARRDAAFASAAIPMAWQWCGFETRGSGCLLPTPRTIRQQASQESVSDSL